MNTEVKESDHPNRRRPWTAVFLSLVMPGLGQIYCGDMANGIVFMLVMTMFPFVWVAGIMHKDTPFWPCSIIMWGIILLATVFAAIDAFRRARRTRYDYQLKDFNHWGIYMALIWIAGAGTIGYTIMVRQNVFEAFRVPSHSMTPTIMAGDRLFASKLAFKSKRPKRGDVVLFSQPEHLSGNYIKRVVALGGDTVEIKDGQLLINGQSLARTWKEEKSLVTHQGAVNGDVFWETNDNVRYQIFLSKQASDRDTVTPDFGPVTVPDHHCFVLGDNRNRSMDSRSYGTLSYGALKGKFQTIYWPLGHRSKI